MGLQHWQNLYGKQHILLADDNTQPMHRAHQKAGPIARKCSATESNGHPKKKFWNRRQPIGPAQLRSLLENLAPPILYKLPNIECLYSEGLISTAGDGQMQ